MANVYVRSGAGGAGTGADWANAYTTLSAALAAKSAGDDFWVSEDHAESTAAAITLTSPGTAASPCRIICVDHTGTVPPVSADLRTTATVTTTGASNISYAGVAYVYGVTFTAGDGANLGRHQMTGAALVWYFDTSKIVVGNTNASGGINFGATGQTKIVFRNTTTKFGATGQGFISGMGGVFEWRDTAAAIDSAGSAPTTLFIPLDTRGTLAWVHGVDLSHLGSGNNLVSVATGLAADFLFENCKLGSSVAIVTGTPAGHGSPIVRVTNCDSADTNYRYAKHTYQGAITSETTIVRTGGASDGTTPISRKMISTANAKFYAPLESDPIIYWNETLGSITVTVPVLTDNVTLTNRDAWVEVEYLGTSGFPLSLTSSDAAADPLATAANQTTDATSTWTTTGIGTPVKQELSVTFTPAEKGLIRARVMLARASTTMYVDPLILVSSGRQYQASGLYLNEAVQAGGGGLLTNPSMGGGMRG